MRNEVMQSAADFSSYVLGTSDDDEVRVFSAEGFLQSFVAQALQSSLVEEDGTLRDSFLPV